MANFEVEQVSRNVHVLRHEVASTVGWEQWYLLSADRHLDHPKSDRKLQAKHLAQAVERNAGVLDFGDMHCAMQGKMDKRSSKKSLRPDDADDAYFDKLVTNATAFFKPYASCLTLIGTGNHETAVLKHHETDLTQRTVDLLNATTDAKVYRGGYTGWVKFNFEVRGTRRASRTLWYNHGYGGDAPVTKGVIQTNRQAVYVPDADFVASGHTHNDWIFPIPRIRLSPAGEIYQDEQLHIKIPSYKNEYDGGWGGWEVERGAPPKNQGAWWLRFYWDNDDIQSEVLRAR